MNVREFEEPREDLGGELAAWVGSEFAEIDLGDVRRDRRLRRLAGLLAAQPAASLPQACGNYAELEAAYRFFDNPAVTAQDIQQGHRLATLERCRQETRVLAVQDTTFLDYTRHPATQGLGPLATPEGYGLCLHTTLALTPDRTPLGILDEQEWVRDPETYGQKRATRSRKHLPIEQKESCCWLRSVEALNVWAEAAKETLFVSVGDREADIFDLFVLPRRQNVHLLIRAVQNRCVEEEEKRLFAAVKSISPCCHVCLRLPERGLRRAREATLSVRTRSVMLRPPSHRSKEGLPCVKVQVVWAHEEHPPTGEEPVSWLLVTTLAVTTDEEALSILSDYACRWQIEVYHKVLKSGCRVEALQLETVEQLVRCVALYAVIAWRVLYATMLSRVQPELPCTVLLAEHEWQALFCHVHQTTNLPKDIPTLRTAVRWIGRLGGYIDRPSGPEPGVTVLWRGMQRLNDLAQLYALMTTPSFRHVAYG